MDRNNLRLASKSYRASTASGVNAKDSSPTVAEDPKGEPEMEDRPGRLAEDAPIRVENPSAIELRRGKSTAL